MARDVLTPMVSGITRDLASGSKGLVYRKQILPVTRITYKGEKLNFDEDYLRDLVKSFNSQAFDQVPFTLADQDNKHNMNPELIRGEVTQVSLAAGDEPPGLYATIAFPNEEAAKAVMFNPKLGVSCRIREGVAKADGRVFDKALVHVCGTADPIVTGMSPWRKVDLSNGRSNTIDLSEATVPKPKQTATDFSQWSDEDLRALATELGVSDDEINAFLDEHGSGDDEGATGEGAADEGDEGEGEQSRQLVGAGAGGGADLSVVHDLAATANQQASEALRQLADTAWKARRSNLVGQGVPPAMVDLCEPLFNRPAGNMVIDLSNEGGAAEVDVTEIASKLLDGMKGYVDLAAEAGHGGQFREGNDTPTTDPVLEAWNKQYPY